MSNVVHAIQPVPVAAVSKGQPRAKVLPLNAAIATASSRLRLALDRAGVTQAWLATHVGVSEKTVSQWCNAHNTSCMSGARRAQLLASAVLSGKAQRVCDELLRLETVAIQIAKLPHETPAELALDVQIASGNVAAAVRGGNVIQIGAATAAVQRSAQRLSRKVAG